MNLTIGENIKAMRRKCGFTQEELAAMLSVTPQAVSKWENGNGAPDISQLIPLSQIFGITTDSLLGVVSAVYGSAHTEAAEGHERLLMSTSLSEAEKHLAVYSYYRAESEREPTNYTIMRKCINHGAGLSRYTDFDGFLSDKPELRDEIFADCERKNACIARYCEDRMNVEKSDYAMAWIYLHTKDFDKAQRMIDRLPSLESNMLRESIMTQLIHFRFGFEKEKAYISENISKLLNVTAKEFFYGLEDYAWFAADSAESIELSEKMLGVLRAYREFDGLRSNAITRENSLRTFLPRCHAAAGNFEAAGEELAVIADNFRELLADGRYSEPEAAAADAAAAISSAVETADEGLREKIKSTDGYRRAMAAVKQLQDTAAQ